MQSRRIVAPERAKAGEIVQIRTVIQHPMTTGHTEAGPNTQKRHIIHTFTAVYDGAEVFRAELQPGIAANPYLAFHFVASRSADLVMTWIDDAGETAVETRRLTVT